MKLYDCTTAPSPRSIPHRVLDVFVPEIRLQSPRVVASVGQRKAAGMPEHVRMHFEAKLRLEPRLLDHAREALRL